ncbi:BatD family protein [Panacibacter ginsenosidivorans]|uniref:BatD family protein n=1 Tax=Panacibacter ginsenosidivorans TaxID=1813871 RepID=UPI001315299C|nr:BatD family protein [Panacibacter ginsenosidivorans]
MWAQQPPAQLPSLLDDGYQSPVLKTGESPETVMRKSIYVKAFASSKSVYTGEPVMVTYKLYASIFCRSRVNKQPSFNGCSVMELSYSGDPDIEIIDGKTFHVFTVRKLQVIPLEDGPLHLGEVEIENIVPFITADKQQDNFSMTSRNEPLIIDVKPLPLTDKPKDFSGVVGSFTMQANVDSNSVPVGDNATLNITIKGSGNFTGIHVPAIQWPHGTEHFEVSDTQHVDQDNYPVEGDKTFSIPFIGAKEGKAAIGPISFNFYDPSTSSYKILTTEVPLTFTKTVSRDEQMQDVVQEDVGNSKYLWIVAGIAAVVIVTLMVSMQLKSRKQSLQIKESVIVPKLEAVVAEQKDYGIEILSALNRLGTVEEDKKFLAAAGYLLIASLQIKLGAPENATADELTELLKKHDNTDLSRTCSKIFADCNRNLYSPDAEEGIKEKIYFELSAVIKKLFPIT